jgi:hypothetical protein
MKDNFRYVKKEDRKKILLDNVSALNELRPAR